MMVEIPAVEQRVYCGTCHYPLRVSSYLARTVEIPVGDEPNIPQGIALVHVPTCPNHPA